MIIRHGSEYMSPEGEEKGRSREKKETRTNGRQREGGKTSEDTPSTPGVEGTILDSRPAVSVPVKWKTGRKTGR